MIGSPTIIGGIPLPSDAPLFLTFVALHVAAGLTCVIAGVVAMLSRKQPGRHPLAEHRVLLGARLCVRHHDRARDLPMGGGLSPVWARRVVIRGCDNWPKGKEKALASLGASPPDWDGRLLRAFDNRFLC